MSVRSWKERLLVGLAALLAAAGCQRAVDYKDQYRPLYHFTPARNWMNDPNGLVFKDGEYHMFFQHNPRGNQWGNMSWGHAVSRDLVNWQELPVVMSHRDDIGVWSGSAVVDWANTSGFGTGGNPPLVALYTGHHDRSGIERQYAAYSNDQGRTWIQYPGNPVLDENAMEFRDPKVFWHEGSRRWVMAVTFVVARTVDFYVSADLKTWRRASSFTPADPIDGMIECPELFEAPVDGGGTRWVLAYSFKAASQGTGSRYIVGDFDGSIFTPLAGEAGRPVVIDHGGDFYASQSWSDIPAADGRRIWIAWMANVYYADRTPTRPWRGAMTIPRSVSLAPAGQGYRLRQSPVAELASLRRDVVITGPEHLVATTALPLPNSQAGAVEFEVTLRPGVATEAGLALHFGAGQQVRIGFIQGSSELVVDRSQAGMQLAGKLTGPFHVPVELPDGALRLRIFLDRSSLEVFAQNGERVVTSLLFPDRPLAAVSAYAAGPGAVIERYVAWQLAGMDRGTGAAAAP